MPRLALRMRDAPPPPGAERRILFGTGDDLLGVLVIDSTRRGPAFGGIRVRTYPGLDEAMADARRLARAMTRKCALARLPAGGAKTVIPWGPAHARIGRRTVFELVGEMVAALGGTYVCGPDVGTSEADLEVVRRVTRWVNPRENDAGASTAAGVRAAMGAALAHVFGGADPADRTVFVQGLGAVGGRLAAGLAREGARVFGSDVDHETRQRAATHGVILHPPDAWAQTPCDVLSPCALGGMLTQAVAARLPCRIVCGSANNQLADRTAARILAGRGVLYVPDEVASAGAVIEGVYTILEAPQQARRRVQAAIAGIADTVRWILDRAGATHDTVAATDACLLERG